MSYNGWTNYATWRVNLEMLDGINPRDMGWKGLCRYNMADALKEYVNEILDSETRGGFVLDYARAFLSDVNWQEIAEHIIEDYELENENENEDEDEDANV